MLEMADVTDEMTAGSVTVDKISDAFEASEDDSTERGSESGLSVFVARLDTACEASDPSEDTMAGMNAGWTPVFCGATPVSLNELKPVPTLGMPATTPPVPVACARPELMPCTIPPVPVT